jgi:hypothetical protein
VNRDWAITPLAAAAAKIHKRVLIPVKYNGFKLG